MGRRHKHKSYRLAKNPVRVIRIYNRQKTLPIDKGRAKALVNELFDFLGISAHEMNLYFVSTKKISSLHDEFFDDPTTTDCISFPIDSELLGEVFVCPETALTYAKKHQLDAYEEATLYVVHGLLHLIGYDDLEPAKKRVMRKKEKSCMAHLRKHSLLLQ